MCGICGVVNFNNSSVGESKIRRMMDALKYRGPDDAGIYLYDSVGFGHVRLSILDLSSAGKQPMVDNNNICYITYNGEVYNYIELRSILKEDYSFKTNTDTEVILAAYLKWGKDCINKFNGMFAFAIYDTRDKSVFIARDRFGIKPLYYYLSEESFVFASDVPGILAYLNIKPTANYQTVHDFLLFNRVAYNENTFFDGIKKLQHGHEITIKDNSLKIKKWYEIGENFAKPFIEPKEFEAALSDSIKLRMRSDVPVGLSFSGGLDSSSLASLIIDKLNFSEIHSFSAVYKEGERGDESKFIREYEKKLKNMHFVHPDSLSFFADLENFIEALVEPIPDTSEYAEYKVMELAKNHCTVILNGQGADETLGGYLYFFGFLFKELLRNRKFAELTKQIYSYTKMHDSNEGIISFIFFLMPSFLKQSKLLLKRNYIRESFSKEYSNKNEIVTNLYNSKSFKEACINHFEYKFEHHLSWGDRSSMWFSLESRFPFLDHSFVERLLATDTSLILDNGVTKKILREALSQYLPTKIGKRIEKVGFETPESNWLKDSKLKELVFDKFNSVEFKKRNIIDHNKILQLYQRHLNNEKDFSKEIFKCLQLELWFNRYID